MAGVLDGITVIEFAGIGPGPFACMMLADHGARVIRIERPGVTGRHGVGRQRDILNRSRERLELDLKDAGAIAQIRELVKSADAIVEGYRPRVMERLGLGPDVLLGDNPKRVVREDLRNFKRIMEIGEVLTIIGQPHGTCTGQGKPYTENQWRPLFT